MDVVVLNHSIISTHIASVHKAGCRDIERERRAHGSSVYGPFVSVDAAISDYLDSEMEEMGYTRDDVRVFPCCS